MQFVRGILKWKVNLVTYKVRMYKVEIPVIADPGRRMMMSELGNDFFGKLIFIYQNKNK